MPGSAKHRPSPSLEIDHEKVKSVESGQPFDGLRIESRRREVTAADVEAFARLTGDLHPVHLDAEWASSSIFGERIAPGMLVLSFSIALVELDYSRVVALRRLRHVVFKRPAYFGDTIYVDAVVTGGKQLNADISLVDLRWIVRNGEDRTLLRAALQVLWRTTSVDQPAAGVTGQQEPGRASEDRPPGALPL